MPINEEGQLEGQETVEQGSEQSTEQGQEANGEQQEQRESQQPNQPTRKTDTPDYWKSEYMREKKRRQQLSRDLERTRTGYSPNRRGLADQDKERPNDLRQVKTVEDFEKYVLHKAEERINQRLTESQKSSRLESSEELSRRTHDGSDGLPAYDDLVDEVVAPLIERNPQILQLLAELDNPAEAAYTLGIVLKYPNLAETLKGQGRAEVVKQIDQQSKQAVTLRGGKKENPRPAKTTADEIMKWTPDQTEREIAKVTGRSF